MVRSKPPADIVDSRDKEQEKTPFLFLSSDPGRMHMRIPPLEELIALQVVLGRAARG